MFRLGRVFTVTLGWTMALLTRHHGCHDIGRKALGVLDYRESEASRTNYWQHEQGLVRLPLIETARLGS